MIYALAATIRARVWRRFFAAQSSQGAVEIKPRRARIIIADAPDAGPLPFAHQKAVRVASLPGIGAIKLSSKRRRHIPEPDGGGDAPPLARARHVPLREHLDAPIIPVSFRGRRERRCGRARGRGRHGPHPRPNARAHRAQTPAVAVEVVVVVLIPRRPLPHRVRVRQRHRGTRPERRHHRPGAHHAQVRDERNSSSPSPDGPDEHDARAVRIRTHHGSLQPTQRSSSRARRTPTLDVRR